MLVVGWYFSWYLVGPILATMPTNSTVVDIGPTCHVLGDGTVKVTKENV